MKIAVLGPGGIGGLLAAILARAGEDVVCVARPETAAAIHASGLSLESKMFGSFTVRVQAVSRLHEPPDVLIVTTKAYDLEAALGSIPPDLVEKAVVVPLLNGFEHLAIIRKRLRTRVAPAMISVVAMKKDHRTILHLSPHARIEIASHEVAHGELETIAGIWLHSGIPTSVLDREPDVIWNKFARLASLSAATASLQKPLGAVRSAHRELLEELVRESVAAANTAGAAIQADRVMRELDQLPADLTTSLQRDVAARRVTEADALLGAVIRLLERGGLPHDAFSRASAIIGAGV